MKKKRRLRKKRAMREKAADEEQDEELLHAHLDAVALPSVLCTEDGLLWVLRYKLSQLPVLESLGRRRR